MTEQAPTVETVSATDSALSLLEEKFRDAVRRDDREGYDGLIVDPARLVEVATAVRDELGYDYLASAQAVDYLGAGDHLEMVYNVYRTAGGPEADLRFGVGRGFGSGHVVEKRVGLGGRDLDVVALTHRQLLSSLKYAY